MIEPLDFDLDFDTTGRDEAIQAIVTVPEVEAAEAKERLEASGIQILVDEVVAQDKRKEPSLHLFGLATDEENSIRDALDPT